MKQFAYIVLCLVVMFLALGGWWLLIASSHLPEWAEWAAKQTGFGVVVLAILRISKGMPK